MKQRAVVFVLIDGLADVSLAQLDGQTTLQAARTPAMDAIARTLARLSRFVYRTFSLCDRSV